MRVASELCNTQNHLAAQRTSGASTFANSSVTAISRYRRPPGLIAFVHHPLGYSTSVLRCLAAQCAATSCIGVSRKLPRFVLSRAACPFAAFTHAGHMQAQGMPRQAVRYLRWICWLCLATLLLAAQGGTDEGRTVTDMSRMGIPAAWASPQHAARWLQVDTSSPALPTDATSVGVDTSANATCTCYIDPTLPSYESTSEPTAAVAGLGPPTLDVGPEASDENGYVLVMAGSMSFTGRLAFGGVPIAHAAELAIHWWNERYGAISAPIGRVRARILLWDDESSPALAEQIYAELVKDPNVQVLTAPFSSGMLAPFISLIDKVPKLVIACCIGSESLVRAGSSLFSMNSAARFEHTNSAQAFLVHGARRAITVADISNPYFLSACNASAIPSFEAYPGQPDRLRLVASVEFNGQLPAAQLLPVIDGVLDMIERGEADIILGCTFWPFCAQFVARAAERRVTLPGAAFEQCPDTPAFIESFSGYSNWSSPAQFLSGTTYWSPTFTSRQIIRRRPDPSCTSSNQCWGPEQFTREYRAAYVTLPSDQSATMFSAIQVLAYAVARSASDPVIGRYTVSKQALACQLQLGVFPSVSGDVLFSAAGLRQFEPYMVQRLNGANRSVRVAPTRVAELPLVFPAPTWAERACLEDQGCVHGLCQPDGSCICSRGWTGPRCNLPELLVVLLPLLVALILMVCCTCCCLCALSENRVRRAEDTLQEQTQQLKLMQKISTRTFFRTISTCSHELSNPTMAIIGSLSLLESTQLDDSQRDIAQDLKLAAAHLSHLLTDMRVSAQRSDSYNGSIHVHSVSLMDVLRDVHHRVLMIHALEVKCLSALPAEVLVTVDPVRLRQLLTDLTASVVYLTKLTPTLMASSYFSGYSSPSIAASSSARDLDARAAHAIAATGPALIPPAVPQPGTATCDPERPVQARMLSTIVACAGQHPWKLTKTAPRADSSEAPEPSQRVPETDWVPKILARAAAQDSSGVIVTPTPVAVGMGAWLDASRAPSHPLASSTSTGLPAEREHVAVTHSLQTLRTTSRSPAAGHRLGSRGTAVVRHPEISRPTPTPLFSSQSDWSSSDAEPGPHTSAKYVDTEKLLVIAVLGRVKTPGVQRSMSVPRRRRKTWRRQNSPRCASQGQHTQRGQVGNPGAGPAGSPQLADEQPFPSWQQLASLHWQSIPCLADPSHGMFRQTSDTSTTIGAHHVLHHSVVAAARDTVQGLSHWWKRGMKQVHPVIVRICCCCCGSRGRRAHEAAHGTTGSQSVQPGRESDRTTAARDSAWVFHAARTDAAAQRSVPGSDSVQARPAAASKPSARQPSPGSGTQLRAQASGTGLATASAVPASTIQPGGSASPTPSLLADTPRHRTVTYAPSAETAQVLQELQDAGTAPEGPVALLPSEISNLVSESTSACTTTADALISQFLFHSSMSLHACAELLRRMGGNAFWAPAECPHVLLVLPTEVRSERTAYTRRASRRRAGAALGLQSSLRTRSEQAQGTHFSGGLGLDSVYSAGAASMPHVAAVQPGAAGSHALPRAAPPADGSTAAQQRPSAIDIALKAAATPQLGALLASGHSTPYRPALLRNAPRVLVVEDERVNRKVVCTWLQRAGMHVTAVTDGREVVPALQAAAAAGMPVQVVLMDIVMREVGGLEAMQRIRRAFPKRPPTVLAMTANATQDDLAICACSEACKGLRCAA